ncbi:uncharacterized protein B0H18DRAFT_1120493 [Fomitopsis serialis]|uniref:uncharacterized protein n=1 Tax=Fomitopsis serialis TaxID=139415 RepID=UPI0020089C7C|nr:uncharacterized protein B0H18DRAFT_1120493 [Neoantrodia serialis]KAH9923226.1 hypothetical protein B0H18DRAFT_1120493 [Neoantrodia serialis]
MPLSNCKISRYHPFTPGFGYRHSLVNARPTGSLWTDGGDTIHIYGPFYAEDDTLLAAYPSRSESQDAINFRVVGCARTCSGTKLLDIKSKPSDPTQRFTYGEVSIGYLKPSSARAKER